MRADGRPAVVGTQPHGQCAVIGEGDTGDARPRRDRATDWPKARQQLPAATVGVVANAPRVLGASFSGSDGCTGPIHRHYGCRRDRSDLCRWASHYPWIFR